MLYHKELNFKGKVNYYIQMFIIFQCQCHFLGWNFDPKKVISEGVLSELIEKKKPNNMRGEKWLHLELATVKDG